MPWWADAEEGLLAVKDSIGSWMLGACHFVPLMKRAKSAGDRPRQTSADVYPSSMAMIVTIQEG